MPEFYDEKAFLLKAKVRELSDHFDQLKGKSSILEKDKSDFIEFFQETNGKIIWKGQKGYEERRKIFYNNFENLKPNYIAVCDTVKDVVDFLNRFKTRGDSFTPRSGGHSTAGFSSLDGHAMLDLRKLNAITFAPDKKSVTVGPGTRFDDLYADLACYKLFLPAGICPQVRAGGYMQGGGYGFGSRMKGINCDSLIHATVVIWNHEKKRAELVDASNEINRDLFWAIRGGTGNNFGIVVQSTYEVEKKDNWGGIALYWRLETDKEASDGAKALTKMEDQFMNSNNDRRFGYMPFVHYMNETKNDETRLVPYLLMRALYQGNPPLGSEIFEDLIKMDGCKIEWEKGGDLDQMTADLYTFTSYEHAKNYSGTQDLICNQFYSTEPEHLPYQEKQSRYFQKNFGFDKWHVVVNLMRKAADKNAYNFTNLPELNIEPGGGAINDVSRGGNAFIHRNFNHNSFMNTYWTDEDQKKDAMRFMDDWLEICGEFSNGEAYQNYPKSYLDNWSKRFWGEYFNVLVAVKYKYDPENFFTFEQGVLNADNAPSKEEALKFTEKNLVDIYQTLTEPIRIN